MANNLAVLAGNGLSIAFNHELNLESITRELIEQLKNASDNGDKVVHAMNEIARRAEGDTNTRAVTADDFEKLVGAFDSQAITLEELSRLAQLVEADDSALKKSIEDVAAFSQRVRDMGISYVLETIMKRSQADHFRDEKLHRLFKAILDEFQGEVYIGNLNYDALLMATLKAIKAPMCDMAYGPAVMDIRVVGHDEDDPDSEPIEAARYTSRNLRRSLNFPVGASYRVKLLHMHGSLTYWHSTKNDIHLKVPLNALRNHNLWEGLRSNGPEWRPSVVLANALDKTRHAKDFPYGLAYEAFRKGLRDSDHWLIIGYSFRDHAINEELRAEFASREKKPSVLVCTKGEDPATEVVQRAFGWGAEDGSPWEWLSFVRTGAVGLEEDFAWQIFAPSWVG